MGLGDCVRCVKYLLFVFNLIFCLLGLTIVALGVWSYVTQNLNEWLSEDTKAQYAGSIFLIVIGSIIALLGFLGCCGAIFENRCILVLFFILLLLVFLVLIIAGIFILLGTALVANISLEHLFRERQNSSIARNQTDFIQLTLNCCGWDKGGKDYTEQNLSIPDSCRPNTTTTYVSCSDKLEELFRRYTIAFAIATLVTAFITLLGMIFSMMLCCAITA